MSLGDDSTPQELLALLGNEFVFKLKLNNYKKHSELHDYIVTGIFEPDRFLETDYEATLSSKVNISC